MRKFGVAVAVICGTLLGICIGGLVTAEHFIKRTIPDVSDGPWTIQMASIGCVLAYRMKDPTADAERESHKAHPKFRSVFTNGEWAGNSTVGFPLRCAGEVNDAQWFKGIDEYVIEPGDGDNPSSVQNECSIAKYHYAKAFNERLGRNRPTFYRSACDANEWPVKSNTSTK